ncbi:hypothetical protein DL93DRAFT_2082810 [Clavulina sp. PMI_390]|nr:hypothetical protein DL93DRAFT_2082810 [Clavulina sp. PMI_390]
MAHLAELSAQISDLDHQLRDERGRLSATEQRHQQLIDELRLATEELESRKRRLAVLEDELRSKMERRNDLPFNLFGMLGLRSDESSC